MRRLRESTKDLNQWRNNLTIVGILIVIILILLVVYLARRVL